MTTILFVEDENEFRDSFGDVLQAHDKSVKLLNIVGFTAKEGEPIEDQFANWVRELESQNGPITGALLDTDLSMNREGVSQSLARQALHSLGIPACRYSKKGKPSPSDILRQLKFRMTEGAQAVPFTTTLNLAEDVDKSADWVLTLFHSFAHLSEEIKKNRSSGDGPAALLARVLSAPDAEVDFATYREAYPFYFADLLEQQKEDQLATRRLCTQVAYWFVNCILAFPGPLLNAGAAAAVLGLDDQKQLGHERVSALLKKCEYTGPFSQHGPYFWRTKILDELDERETAKQIADAYNDLGIKRPVAPSRYCLILDRPLRNGETPMRPDWIPAGAVESYVERKTYNQLNPWIQTPR